MLTVWWERQNSPDTGTPHVLLQPMEKPATKCMENTAESYGKECELMLICAGLQLFPMEKSNKAEMGVLAATDVGKFPLN